MSHISRLRTRMVEEGLVKQGIERLGFAWTEGPTTVEDYGNRSVQVDFKMEAGRYPIGFVRTPNGLEAVGDLDMGRGRSLLQRLHQQYARLATLRKLEEQGFAVVEETDRDGTLRLTLERLVYG